MIKQALAVLGAAVLMFTLQAPPAQAASPAAERYAKAAMRATNAVRADHGVRPVRVNTCLKRMAARQAKRMAARRAIYHQDLGVVLRACDLSMVGENVAAGYRSGKGVVRSGWMRSPGHRRNLLDPAFGKVGIAARRAGGRWYVAQVFGRR